MTQPAEEESPRQAAKEAGTKIPQRDSGSAEPQAHANDEPSAAAGTRNAGEESIAAEGMDGDGKPGPAEAEADVENEDAAERPDAGFVVDELRRIAGDRFRIRDQFNRGQSAMGEGSIAAENIIFNGATGAPGGRRRIEARLIAELAASYQLAYVTSDVDERLERELDRRSLVVLSGPDSSGRTATACVALARRHGSPARVASFDLLPSEQLTDLTRMENSFIEGAGHLVQLGDARVADAMTLAALASHARSLDATMVIVIDSEQARAVSSSLLVGHVRHARPPAREVFEAHLLHRLKDYACLAACMQCRGDCVGAYVSLCLDTPGLIDPAGRLHVLVETAEEVALHRPRGDKLRAFGVSRSTSEEQAVIDRLLTFDEKPDVDAGHARAFRIACVLFQGEPLNSVVDVAESFVRASEGTADASPLRPPAGGYQALLGAELSATWMPAGDRRTAESRRAAENGMARKLVDALWAGALRPKDLLRWLNLLVTEGRDPRVRRTAALLAGGCAEHDFGEVCTALMEPWARASAWWVRECAGLSLVAAAFSPQTRPLVRDCIQRWAKSDSARMRDTVSRAYAAGLSALMPSQGQTDLLWVSSQPFLRRSTVVAEALSRLDLPSDSLLTMLLVWADLRFRLPATHAVRAFVLLAGRMAESGSAPDLLARMAAGDVSRTDLARLWQLALLDPSSAFNAWERLGDWVRMAPDDPSITGSFLALMSSVAEDPQVRDRLRHQLTYVWRGRVTASRILDQLDRIVEEP